MDKAELAIQRGAEAELLLQNPMFAKAFSDTRAGIFMAMEGVATDSPELTELHRMVKLLGRVESCLRKHIETGQITQKAIQGKKNLFGR